MSMSPFQDWSDAHPDKPQAPGWNEPVVLFVAYDVTGWTEHEIQCLSGEAMAQGDGKDTEHPDVENYHSTVVHGLPFDLAEGVIEVGAYGAPVAPVSTSRVISS